MPGSSYTYIQQNEQYIIAHITQKDIIKRNTNVIYYNNDKMSDTAEAKYKYGKNSPKLSRAPQGRRLGDERLEVLVVLVALSEHPSRRQELSSSSVSQEEKE